jgi:hypothetical protein
MEHGPYTGQSFQIDSHLFLGWRVKTMNLLDKACGLESQHFKEFKEIEKSWGSGSFERTLRYKAILQAAQEDYDGGYLNNVKTIVQAEVFDSELEQASELLANGYKSPAAVVAGVVIETTLKDLCDKHGINRGKLERMNADLCKAGTYTLLVQKQITALAQIRNDAAHGNSEAFQDGDVKSMIEDVRRFVTNYT